MRILPSSLRSGHQNGRETPPLRNRSAYPSRDLESCGLDAVLQHLHKKVNAGIFRILPGGSLAETCRITSLSKEKLLTLNVVDLGAGVASTAAELALCRSLAEPNSAAARGSYTALDIIYQLNKTVLEAELNKHFKELPRQLEENKKSIAWQNVYHSYPKRFFKGAEHYTGYRQKCSRLFLQDYDLGMAEGRYVFGVAPGVRWNQEVDLVLINNVLSENKPAELKRLIIENCLEFAKKIMIFPVPVNSHGQLKQSMQHVVNRIRQSRSVTCKVKETNYEFRNGIYHRLEITKH